MCPLGHRSLDASYCSAWEACPGEACTDLGDTGTSILLLMTSGRRQGRDAPYRLIKSQLV